MKATQGRRRSAMRLSTAALVSPLVVMGAAVGTAHASTVGCGSTVTEDTVLTQSLDCADGAGLILAPGVSLDLGGHTLSGRSASQGLELQGGNRVSNGAVNGFGTAVYFMSGDPSTASGISSDGSLIVGGHLTVRDSIWTNSSLSVGGGVLDISDSTISDARLNAQVGGVLSVSGSTLKQSPLAFNRGSIKVSGSLLDGGQSDISPLTGTYAGSAQVTASTVRGFKRPMMVSGGSLTVRDVVFEDNPAGAVSSTRTNYIGSVISVENSTFRRSGVAVSGGPMGRLSVSGSTFTDGVTGVEAMEPAQTSVMGNTFTGQSDSGVRVTASAQARTADETGGGIQVGSNKAERSAQYGLFVPGAVDRGGNVANSNGTDCVGVTCAQA